MPGPSILDYRPPTAASLRCFPTARIDLHAAKALLTIRIVFWHLRSVNPHCEPAKSFLYAIPGNHDERSALRQAELAAIIDRWVEAKRVEAFFEDAGRRAANLEEGASSAMVERLERARKLLGGVDALERFRSWKAPDER